MGNRAVVKFENDGEKHGIYLHWNGGPESVLAFLRAMEDRRWTRMDYASARFVGVVSEFFDSEGDCSGLSLGIVDDPESWRGGCDNGLYEVSRGDNGFRVLHRGKVITPEGLTGRELKQFDGMVEVLSRCRAARKVREEATV